MPIRRCYNRAVSPLLGLELTVAAVAVGVSGGLGFFRLEHWKHQRRHRRALAEIGRLERDLEVGSRAAHLEAMTALQRRKMRREMEDARQRLYDEEMRPRAGRALRRRKRIGKPTVEGYLASLDGPLPYMRRLKAIESLTLSHRRLLEDRWWELAERHEDDPPAFENAWLEVADTWNFDKVNALIDEHNRNYPVGSEPAARPEAT